MSLQYHEVGDLSKDLPIDGVPWVPKDNAPSFNVSDCIPLKKCSLSPSSHETGTCSSSSELFEILNQHNNHLSSSIVTQQGQNITLINDDNTQQQPVGEDEIGHYDTGQDTPTQSNTTVIDYRQYGLMIPEHFEDDPVLSFRGMNEPLYQPQSLMSCDETNSELSSSLIRVLKGTSSTQDTEEDLMYCCTETCMESNASASSSCWVM